MSTETFYGVVKLALDAGTWTARGEDPFVKRFSEEKWQSMTEYGVLLQDTLKLPILAVGGAVIFENTRGLVRIADTKQELLNLAEADLKRILKDNFCMEIYSWVYENPMENMYGLRAEIKIID